MKKHKLFSILLLLFISVSALSQRTWTKLNEKIKVVDSSLEYRESKPTSFDLFSLKKQLISNVLLQSSKTEQIIELPTPNGIQRFKIKESSVLSHELAVKFPNIKSYVGVGIDDQTARVRLSNSKIGLHAMISSGKHPMYLIAVSI